MSKLPLTEELARGDLKLSNPLWYKDFAKYVSVYLRITDLARLREADAPVSEFISWMHENRTHVNTIGELVRLSFFQYHTAKAHEKRNVLPIIIEDAKKNRQAIS